MAWPACTSPSGRLTPRTCRSSATSTAGTPTPIRSPGGTRPASGSAFIPGVKAGALYKYRVVGPDGRAFGEKADPYGFAAEIRPQTASKVAELDGYEWHDADWIAGRVTRDATHAADVDLRGPPRLVAARSPRRRTRGSRTARWRPQLADYVEWMGYTHVELLPVTEHPFDGSWGYQTIGYFAPTSRFGGPHDLMYLDRHAASAWHRRDSRLGSRALPARRARARLLRRHAPLRARGPEARPPSAVGHVHLQLRRVSRSATSSSATRSSGFDRYHVDGLRVDAVASMLYLDYAREAGEWTPNRYGGRENLEAIEFIRLLNDRVHAEYPGVPVMAEESTSWPMVTRPTESGARLRLQVEHGVDARHARVHVDSIRCIGGTTTTRSRSA